MSYGRSEVFTKTITTGGSITSEFDLGRSWTNVYLVVPALSSAVATSTCNVYVQAGASASATYYDVVFPPTNSATTGVITFTLANSISQCVVPIPNALPFLKVRLGNTATAAVTFQIICSGE
jgi:hypothetical protein